MSINSIFTIYWPFVAFVIAGMISVLVTWNNLNNKVIALKTEASERDKDIAELKGRINAMTPDMNTIKTDVAVIKNDIAYIKGSLQNKSAAVTNIN